MKKPVGSVSMQTIEIENIQVSKYAESNGCIDELRSQAKSGISPKSAFFVFERLLESNP